MYIVYSTDLLLFHKGSCRINKTDDCVIKEKESRIVREDKNFVLFRNKFENALIGAIFQKKDDDDDSDNNDENSTATTTATPVTRSPSSPCVSDKVYRYTLNIRSIRRS